MVIGILIFQGASEKDIVHSGLEYTMERSARVSVFPGCLHGYVYTIDILYTLDSASLLVKLKPRIFQRLPPFE
jgi:hypothetical protein